MSTLLKGNETATGSWGVCLWNNYKLYGLPWLWGKMLTVKSNDQWNFFLNSLEYLLFLYSFFCPSRIHTDSHILPAGQAARQVLARKKLASLSLLLFFPLHFFLFLFLSTFISLYSFSTHHNPLGLLDSWQKLDWPSLSGLPLFWSN